MGRVTAFIPGLKFPSISITGTYCHLGCDFCRSNYLKGMKSALTPKELYDVVRYFVKRGARGVLISGGFNQNGVLPVEPFLPAIRDIKRDFNIIVSIHAGLADEALATRLRDAKVDVVDFELVVDDYVIRNVMHLRNRSSNDFIKSLEVLSKYGPPYVVPHIPIGLNYGRVTKEMEATNIAVDNDPQLLIYLVLTPTDGTPMSSVKPPEVTDVVNVITYGRGVFNGEIALGCMRPWFMKYTLDFKVCELGVIDRVVNPLRKLIETYNLDVIEACCSIPRELLNT